MPFLHFFAGTPGDPEGWFACVGFAALFIGAGLLALLGTYRERPALLLAAGLAALLMSLVSIVLIPLAIPALLLVTRALNEQIERRDLAAAALLAIVLVSAFAFLVFHQDPVTWSTPEGTGGSSNIVTSFEAALSISATAAVVVVAFVRFRTSLTQVSPPQLPFVAR